jgi:hypothetical protein
VVLLAGGGGGWRGGERRGGEGEPGGLEPVPHVTVLIFDEVIAGFPVAAIGGRRELI